MNAKIVSMIAMVTPHVKIPKAHSTARARKDFLETENTAALVSVPIAR